mgnify:FL=1
MPDADAASTPANWLILADRNPEHGAGLAQSLEAKLKAAGHHARLAIQTGPEELDGLLRNGATGPVNHVVHLDGLAWADAHQTPEELLALQTRRCATAAAVIQACERTQTAATVWLVTADAVQYLSLIHI